VLVPKTNPKPRGRDRAERIKLALAFASIYIVWGSTYLAIRYAVETIRPLVTAGIRHTVAGGILLAWALARGYRSHR
jgi:drug/metabolite transporter (DMT)-like permease